MKKEVTVKALLISCVAACAVLLLAGCGPVHFSDVQEAPRDDGGSPFDPPDEAPPTGSKWEGRDVTGECGRTYRTWVLVDEVCGATERPSYVDSFVAPMFRDGALIGETLFAVDGSSLWLLDVSKKDAPSRRAVLSGLGNPVAAASHGDLVLLASGDEGLVVLDASAPGPREVARLPLGGPVLDVFVEGDTAFVAAGPAGVAVIDLSQGVPNHVKTLAIPGFAAGVAASGPNVFVAACDNFFALDFETGAVVGGNWVADAYEEGVLAAPARDVALVGGVAFVAAGRRGAVAIDVANPSSPRLLGNCLVPGAENFYASGVRARADLLYVAAGEWGILPIDVTDPLPACSGPVAPVPLDVPSDEDACSTEPPWKIVDWEDAYEPPLPGDDPLQTLPEGDVVYAFGDARRLGFRAVDLYTPFMDRVGRYEEPMVATGVAAGSGRVLVTGPKGGLFRPGGTDPLAREPGEVPEIDRAVSSAFMSDGRWVIATDEPAIIVENAADAVRLSSPVSARSLASRDGKIYAGVESGMFVIDADSGTAGLVLTGMTAELPPAALATAQGVVLAAPEWVQGIVIGDAKTTLLAPHGAFDSQSILDLGKWLSGVPRRLLAETSSGVAEIASLGGRARLVIHSDPPSSLDLPRGTYIAAAGRADRVFVLSVDRGRYRTTLLTVLAGAGPAIEAVEAFSGSGTGVAADGDRLYVTDAGHGVRVYDTSGGMPALLGVVSLEVTP